jgi:hypothetical protein
VVVNGKLQWGQTEKRFLATFPIEKSQLPRKKFANVFKIAARHLARRFFRRAWAV